MCGISAIFALGEKGKLHDPSETCYQVNQSRRKGSDSGYSSDGTEELEKETHSKQPTILESLNQSLELIKHRGPDSRNTWFSGDGQIGFGHVRLAINGLGLEGVQPFHDAVGQIHAVVNGELYDSDRIREELSQSTDYTFRGTSDSEIVIALYLKYGESFLKHLRGEFSVCIYNSRTKTLIAARDRYGVKPLFYTKVGHRLLVASEAKAFLPLGWFPKWDVKALMDEGWRQDQRTPFKDVSKVRPGHYLVCNAFGSFEHRQYWDIDFPDKRVADQRTEEQLVTEVRERLLDSIRLRLRADVPVGVYLSGGLDSSVVAGMMCHLIKEEGHKPGRQSGLDRVTCFSIAFDQGSGMDESDIARRTAEHLGVKFVPKHMNEEEIAKRFEDAVWHAEHQNYDLNFVGKFALSEAPREQGYKVVLTGEGADEVFGGYPAHLRDFIRSSDPAWLQSQLSEPLRRYHEELIQVKTEEYYSKRALNPINATTSQARTSLAQVNDISSPVPMAAYQFPPSYFMPWIQETYGTSDPLLTVTNNTDGRVRTLMQDKWHPLHSALYCWSKGNLSNVLLACLGDRAEMAHSIEGRVPFIDHELASFVNGIPPSLKIKYNTPSPGEDAGAGTFTEKWILREAARPFITDEIYTRKKHGYAAPTNWPINGHLHNMFKRLITRRAVEDLGFVDWDAVKDVVDRAFVSGTGLHTTRALRKANVLAQWVVLGQRFRVEKAHPPSSKTRREP